jgi:hypothetical protein
LSGKRERLTKNRDLQISRKVLEQKNKSGEISRSTRNPCVHINIAEGVVSVTQRIFTFPDSSKNSTPSNEEYAKATCRMTSISV